MAAVLSDDVNDIGEFDRGGNVFTRAGAASVSSYHCVGFFWRFLPSIFFSVGLHID